MKYYKKSQENYSMAFLRTKKFGGRVYFYLVEDHREDKRVKQKVLKYLGTEKPSAEALERLIREIKGR